MFKTHSKMFKTIKLGILLQKSTNLHSKRQLYTLNSYSCICSQIKSIDYRLHSTQSDQHRQKAVIETTSPKIFDLKVTPELMVEKGSSFKERIDPYLKLARWDKPIGIYLLYWPCSWSIALASLSGHVPIQTSLQTAGLFLIGAGLMRGAGCTINDLWDRDVDAKVERTKSRPLVTGAVSQTQAVTFLALQLSLALGVLCQLNCYSIVLGASSMVLVVLYPVAKRFSNYPQVLLGATFNWGALLGYSAIQGYLSPLVVPLYTAALCWTVIYDTIYAHQDKEDDMKIGVKSTAITFGEHTKPALAATLGLSTACFGLVGYMADLGIGYNIATAAYAVHTGLQIYTLDTENPEDCASKFKSNSLVGLIILLGILTGGYKQYKDNRKNCVTDNLQVTKSCVFN